MDNLWSTSILAAFILPAMLRWPAVNFADEHDKNGRKIIMLVKGRKNMSPLALFWEVVALAMMGFRVIRELFRAASAIRQAYDYRKLTKHRRYV